MSVVSVPEAIAIEILETLTTQLLRSESLLPQLVRPLQAKLGLLRPIPTEIPKVFFLVGWKLRPVVMMFVGI